jgi:alpha-beta hydrolase superfamily lysophospholipase
MWACSSRNSSTSIPVRQQPSTQVVWIGEELPAFGLYHAPPPANAQSTAVLFCAPFGWEDMGSYPVRRLWANRLADAGHPVLRFDLPGSGQSAGSPGDPEQLRNWLRSIAQAASWLRDAGHSSAVAAIGVGLGSLLALAAANDGAPIDDLVLWGLPSSGRALARTLRAFSQLQTDVAEADDPSLPTGWLQSGGYVLSAETLADLSSLRSDGERVERLRRALLLDQDGSALNPALIEQLRGVGVDVQSAQGPGYAAMLDSPERSLVPDTTIATVTAWLATEDTPTQRPAEPVPPSRELLELEIDGASASERAFTVEHSATESMFGVLAEPDEASRKDICLICLPAWAERCTGPSRMWVEIARRQAARGVPALRIDLLSVGDSDGSRDLVRTTDSIWDPDRIVQVRQVMDALEVAGYGSHFLLVGLCSGGYWAQQAAAVDSRVDGVLSLNPSVSPAGQALLKDDAARRTLLILKPSWWRKVVRGEVSIKGITTVRRGLQHRVATLLLRSPGRSSGTQEVTTFTTLLDRLQQRGARISLGLSALEPAAHQLQVEGITPHAEHLPVLRIHSFESTDHNLREVRDQHTIHELLDELVRDLLSDRD